MKETKREKYIRFSFILFFMCIVLLGFYLRYKDYIIVEAKPKVPLALVLKMSNSSENPQIVMYRQQDGQHFLAKYEIELENNYFFKTVQAVELKKAADELLLDNDEGFWLKSNGRWFYFSDELAQQERSEQFLGESTAVPFTNNDGTVTVTRNELSFPVNDENILELHPLSHDESIWLLITDNNMKILTIATN